MTRKLRKIHKGFTLVELVVVIAIIAILSVVSVAGFAGITERAKETMDNTTLVELNNLLQIGNISGKIKTTNDAFNYLKDNDIDVHNIAAKKKNKEFVYNKETNEFEYLDSGWEEAIYSEALDNYSSVTDWRTLFGAVVNGNNYGGFREYSDSTKFTYKYLTNDKHVIIGDTVIETNTLRYFLHIPVNYNPRISYPIITYIHGSGGCVFYQTNGMGFVEITDNNYLENAPKSVRWLAGSNNSKVYTHLNNDGTMLHCGDDGALGDWDNKFAIQWIDWIKTHPEDDAFFIFAHVNDEVWFENQNSHYEYSKDGVNYSNLSALTICNAYKAGTINDVYYGSMAGASASAYNSYYNSRILGENINFQLITKLIDNLAETYNINLNRQYIIGASLGGISTIDLVSHNPNRFAAAFPCATPCADVSDENIRSIIEGKTKIVAFHGSSDIAVSMTPIQKFCEAITDGGGDARLITNAIDHSSQNLVDNFSIIIETIKNISK